MEIEVESKFSEGFHQLESVRITFKNFFSAISRFFNSKFFFYPNISAFLTSRNLFVIILLANENSCPKADGCYWLTIRSQPIRICQFTRPAKMPANHNARGNTTLSEHFGSFELRKYRFDRFTRSQNVRNYPKINNKSWESFSFHLGSGQLRNLPPISNTQKGLCLLRISRISNA